MNDVQSLASDLRDAATAALAGVADPEIPVLSIQDMGIVRRVETTDDGGIDVDITPTYSGCPAMDRIRDDVVVALGAAGFDPVRVHTVYSPAWSTDWISEAGRNKLAEYGIAPPAEVAQAPAAVLCPRCAADRVRVVSEFGSTACKALMVCDACGEPFDHFKEL